MSKLIKDLEDLQIPPEILKVIEDFIYETEQIRAQRNFMKQHGFFFEAMHSEQMLKLAQDLLVNLEVAVKMIHIQEPPVKIKKIQPK